MKKAFLALILVFTVFLLSGCYQNGEKLEELNERCSELECQLEESESSFNHLLEKIGSLEDDIATVYCYFDDEDISSEEAQASIERINTVIDNILYPQ